GFGAVLLASVIGAATRHHNNPTASAHRLIHAAAPTKSVSPNLDSPPAGSWIAAEAIESAPPAMAPQPTQWGNLPHVRSANPCVRMPRPKNTRTAVFHKAVFTCLMVMKESRRAVAAAGPELDH